MKGGISLADMAELNELMSKFNTFEETKEAVESRFPSITAIRTETGISIRSKEE
jgi:hypothetical protein